MKLHNEFTVAAPTDRAWETLLDIERVATFLPGATVEPAGEEGVYRGSMRIKVGPVVANYKGTATLGEVDEDQRTAELQLQAKEAIGQGSAAATIHNTVRSVDGKTQVIAETDLKVTGRQAQFGRGIMEDVAGRMLGDFAQRFERYLLDGDEAEPAGSEDEGAGARDRGVGAAAAASAEEPSASSAEPSVSSAEEPSASSAEPSVSSAEEPEDALDLGSVLTQTDAFRYGLIAAAAAVFLIVLAVARRRRSRVALKLSHTW
jgi:carbon monoxide dehydrogenase subunit G